MHYLAVALVLLGILTNSVAACLVGALLATITVLKG